MHVLFEIDADYFDQLPVILQFGAHESAEMPGRIADAVAGELTQFLLNVRQFDGSDKWSVDFHNNRGWRAGRRVYLPGLNQREL